MLNRFDKFIIFIALQQFLMCAKELYGAMLQTVDFHGAVEATRIKINSWVESETQGKTKQNHSHTITAFLDSFNKRNSRV